MTLAEVIEQLGENEVRSWFTSYDMSDYLDDDQIAVIRSRGVWSPDKLAKQIVDHFLVREIGQETIGLFEHQAKVYMNELMEYYLPEIYSASIKIDPLVNVDFTETYDATGHSTGKTDSATNGSSLAINSDTPQGRVNKEDILEGKYATSTNGMDSDSTDHTQSSGETADAYTKRVKGNSGVSATAQALIKQYRDIIVSTNRNIIKDLNILFMGIY